MPRIPHRYTPAIPTLVLSLLIGLMSLPDANSRLLGLLRPTVAAATTFTVNSTGDGADSNLADGVCNDGTGACTFRAAIQQTNAVAGDDTINFNLPANSTITLHTELPGMLGNISVVGPGASLLTIQRSTTAGTPNFRVFTFLAINGSLNNSISGITISNGNGNGGSFPSNSGGGIANYGGTLNLLNASMSGNTGINGGGIYNSGGGTLTITGSTVSGNAASNGAGGGIHNSGGTLNLTNSTVSGNTCDAQGGGIVNAGSSSVATVTNTTISGNTSSGLLGASIGGIANQPGNNTVNLINCTVTNNASGGSGGLAGGFTNSGGSTANISNTIIANNTGGFGNLSGTFTSQGYNFIGASDGNGFTHGTNGDQVGSQSSPLNPQLGPLASNGGPTQTHALLVGSPAIDAGNSALITDQRGQPRPVDDITVTNAAGSNATDIGAYEAHQFQVNSTDDSSDGACTLIGTGNGCTLREAITAANLETGAELITFAPALTSGGPAMIVLSSALPGLSSEMSISGPGAGLLTVQRSAVVGTADFRIFTVNPGMMVTLAGLRVSNGKAQGVSFPENAGGGIFNSGTLTISDCIVSGSTAGGGGGGISNAGTVSNPGTLILNNSIVSGNSAGSGGGIYNNVLSSGIVSVTLNNSAVSGNNVNGSGAGIYNAAHSGSSVATLAINNSTISGNVSSSSNGGGILNAAVFGNALTTLTLTNSTVSGNSCSGDGAGIWHFSNGIGSTARATLTNSTVSSNNAGTGGNGGGIFTTTFNSTTTLMLRNTIVAGNLRNSGAVSSDIFGTAEAASSFNLIGDGSGMTGVVNGSNGNQVGTSVAPINPRLGLLTNNGGPTQTHGLLPGSPAVDAGNNCVLNNACSPALSSAISTDQRGTGFNRGTDGNGDGSTTVDIGAFEVQSILVTNTNDTGAGSLRQAITEANASSGTKAINFQSGLSGTISLLSALPDLSTSMSINGPGSNQLTVQRSTVGGTPDFRIFTIQSGTVNFSGLTISGGFHNGGGAGILANSGSTLNINGCVISGNTDNNFRGGGISSAGTLSLANSTVSGNTGSGIFTENGIIAITNTTLNNNVGSAIRHLSPFPFSISNSTISGNSGGLGGGIFMSGGVLTMSNTTVSGNTALEGGGFFTGGGTTGDTLLLNNCTITGNRGTAGGFFTAGGIQTSGSLTLKNSIVAGNFKDSGTTPGDISLVGGSIQSASSNLIGDANSSGGITHGVNGNQVGNGGSGTINIHTVLAVALANNGGPTLTHALLAGSPALDAGDNCVFDNTCVPPYGFSLTTDQRGTGFARKVDGPDVDTTDTVDIGAFEAQVSIADIADQAINEDGSLSLPFNVGGAASITGVTAMSSNPNLVPNNAANISISGSGPIRTLLINPVPDAFGTSTITVTASGNNSQTMTDTFLLTVTPVNDAPSFTKGLDQTVSNNAGMQTVSNWAINITAGPTNESGQTFSFSVVGNTNPGLFAVAPAVSSTGTLTYAPATNTGGTATISLALQDSGGMANGGQNTSPVQTFNINVEPVGGFVRFASDNFNTTESSGYTTITVTRVGDLSRAVTVAYETGADPGVPCSTANGVASPKCDFTSSLGTLSFAAGEGTKTFTVLINQDSYVEGPETLTLALSNQTSGSALATPSIATLTITDDATEPATNPIDTADAFVLQHYHDFLNREPDADGLAYWSNQITECLPPGATCNAAERRVNVSAAFFLSIEFKETGYLVYRTYKAAYGDAVGSAVINSAPQTIPVPVIRLNEFLPDTQRIGLGVQVGIGNWTQQLENNKQSYMEGFVQSSRFTNLYPDTMTALDFVNALNANAGGALSTAERDQLVSELTSGTKTRAQVLRAVAEDQDLANAEINRAFVLMQYFGYLRRNPNDPGDTDHSGYNFWLGKLNEFNGNFIHAQMVQAFIESIEYRTRFAP